jgi:hypothetical protein
LFAVQIFIDGCFVINKFAVVDTEWIIQLFLYYVWEFHCILQP